MTLEQEPQLQPSKKLFTKLKERVRDLLHIKKKEEMIGAIPELESILNEVQEGKKKEKQQIPIPTKKEKGEISREIKEVYKDVTPPTFLEKKWRWFWINKGGIIAIAFLATGTYLQFFQPRPELQPTTFVPSAVQAWEKTYANLASNLSGQDETARQEGQEIMVKHDKDSFSTFCNNYRIITMKKEPLDEETRRTGYLLIQQAEGLVDYTRGIITSHDSAKNVIVQAEKQKNEGKLSPTEYWDLRKSTEEWMKYADEKGYSYENYTSFASQKGWPSVQINDLGCLMGEIDTSSCAIKPPDAFKDKF